MTKIIEYLKQTYQPLAVIVYGSYADGSNNENSDFDALVIAERADSLHDTAVVGGVQLDVFVYPRAFFAGEYAAEEFVQVFDGNIVLDTDRCAADLKQRVWEHLTRASAKSAEEIRDEIAWCRKMLLRTERPDAEGMFRWHWLLTESLEIFCDAMGHPYFGPKKSLRWMEAQYPEAYECYAAALFRPDRASLERWIDYLGQQWRVIGEDEQG